MRFLLIALFAASFLAQVAYGLDITTADGEVYKQCQITRVESDALRINHSAGIARIPFEKLPKALQKQYFNADAVAAYRGQIEADKLANAIKAAEEERLRQAAADLAEKKVREKAAERLQEEEERRQDAVKAEEAKRAAAEREQTIQTGLYVVLLIGGIVIAVIVVWFLAKLMGSAVRSGRGTLTVIVILIIGGVVGCPRLHNSGIRERLRSCETYGVVAADAYYENVLSSTVVFDLKGGSSAMARRIDAVHLLLQFSGKLDYSSVDRVVLAADGKQRFYIQTTDLKELASSYAGGGRIWAFNNLPERCFTMSGSHPYGTWTGGWLGVAEKQAEDLDSLMRVWFD